MKKYLFWLLIPFASSLFAQNTIATEAIKTEQDISKMRNKKELTRLQIRSKKFIYYDQNYKSGKKKFAFLVNEKDKRTVRLMHRIFRKYNVEAVNFDDIKKPDDYTPEDLSFLLQKEGIDGLIRIKITDDTFVLPEDASYSIDEDAELAEERKKPYKIALNVTSYVDIFDNSYGAQPFVRGILNTISHRRYIKPKLAYINMNYLLDHMKKRRKVFQ